jgi:hypothetical protein
MIADQSLDVFRDDVRGGADPSRTTIPFSATVKNPDAHPMAVVAGLLRNAFVMGLTAAFRGPPPPAEKDRIREQARQGMREGAAKRRAQGSGGEGK